ncbi:benzoate-CoA ligase family protein [Phormidesmis priestleyi ULC007]|uniref:Benzoate-CoA ligase family protein n=1 Tax=Phormidesmis priestleyi ULC007 TaxID=1920490 RepID=A0A2T1DNA2_9CYAN|nr:benzoate-CoA ligase family protein [Phormidesmis priestleyi]PSB21935.1 benzoate-CoA ligase family protein [Phormidesmis priestleyi ULC007]PZO55096.1 MAG: benzoate-CoA ligase family protein [Phormidesmis priestleyi]
MDISCERLPEIFNIAAYFIEGSLSRGHSERIAFYYRDETYTYRTVRSYVRRAATLLSELGLDREDRIAILLPDTPEFIFAFWGAIWAGAVPVPINTACSIDDIQYIIQNCRAKILLTSQEWHEKLTLGTEFLRDVLLVDGETPFLSRLDQTSEEATPSRTSPCEPAFWLYTSGSTGRPKGVVHMHSSMVVSAQRYGKDIVGLHENDITYSIAKMPFAYGLGNTLYMTMAVGAASVLSDAANAFDIIADLHRYQPTVLFGVPSTYASILAVKEMAPLETPRLRLCLSAAEQLPKTIWTRWLQAYGYEICEGIGTTELLHIFLSNRPGECQPGSSGFPVPGYEVEILDDQGYPVKVGEIGTLQVTGKSLMLGYWNRIEETRKVIYGNSIRTGDQYQCDAEGFFWFMGRKDDLFKVNGQWTSPFEIEEVLLQHESLLDVAIVPQTDAQEVLPYVVAFVTLKAGFTASSELEDGIRRFAKSRLPHFKAPKAIHFLDKLPRTPTGKIHRKALGTKLALVRAL